MVRIGTLAILLATCACAHVAVTRYTDTKFPPSASVEVTHEKPQRPYQELAELRVRASENAVMEMTATAKRLGADVLIIGATLRGEVIEAVNPATGMVVPVQNDDVMTAVAVRWR